MSVRRIRNALWVDFRFNHVRYRKRSPDNSKAGAEAYEALLRQKLARGESIEGDRKGAMTFEAFAKEWYESYVEANNKLSDRRTKQSILNNHLLPFFGRMVLSDIGVVDIERYKAKKLGEQQTAKSVNNHLAIIRKCLRCAAEWGRIKDVPLAKPLKVPPQKIDFLLEAEQEALIIAADAPEDRAMLLLALHTGMRLGEILGLEWSAVDFAKSQITVCQSYVRGFMGSPKSNRIRHIPMTKPLTDALHAIRHARGLVFRRKDGKPLSDMMAYTILKRVRDKARVRRIGWHIMRHTFASRLVSRGVPIRTVQQLLGHSTVVMTERYAHLAPAVFTDAIRVLENAPTEHFWATGGQRDVETMVKTLFKGTTREREITRT